MTFQRRYKTTTVSDIERCFAAGMTATETARSLEVSPRMLLSAISVLGIRPPRSPELKTRRRKPSQEAPGSVRGGFSGWAGVSL